MMNTAPPCRPWLPVSALRTATVEALIGDVLRGWSRDWLARRSLTLSGRLAHGDSTSSPSSETRWFVFGDSVALSMPVSAQPVLARAMLDAAESEEFLTDEDRRVCDDLLRGALDDLQSRLRLFGHDDDERWTELSPHERPQLIDRWKVAISLGAGVPLFELALSNDALIVAIRNALPRPERTRRVSSRMQALLSQRVEVSARVGHARVSLADLAELSAGDVIVLETGLNEPATLAIDTRPRPGLLCNVERREPGFVLELLNSLRG